MWLSAVVRPVLLELLLVMTLRNFRFTADSRKVVGKKHKSARNKTKRWSGYVLEFCIFEREEFVFHLRRLFSKTLLLLSHV